MMFVFDPLGDIANAVALAVVLIAAFSVFTARDLNRQVNATLLMLAGLIVLIAALEILHPNVPAFSIGLIGFRKSATFVLGIAIGIGWKGSRLDALRLAWWCLLVSATASLIVHIGFPSIEGSIAREAGKYTSQIGGIDRMQGLFAGPFHVSMVGVFLVLSALTPKLVIEKNSLRIWAAAVGLACVYFAQVRTGLVALGAGAALMLLLTGSAQRWANRFLGAAALGILAAVYIGPVSEQVRRFTALRRLFDGGLEDQRFTGRFESWSTGIDMITRSPVVGSGSGSAGDTLGRYFAAGQHVTSHNAFLKYAVEGGLAQGVLFAALCIGIGFAVRPSRDATHFGIAAGVPLLVFSVVGAASEALPIAFGMAVILGLCTVKRPHEQVAGVEGSGSMRQNGHMQAHVAPVQQAQTR